MNLFGLSSTRHPFCVPVCRKPGGRSRSASRCSLFVRARWKPQSRLFRSEIYLPVISPGNTLRFASPGNCFKTTPLEYWINFSAWEKRASSSRNFSRCNWKLKKKNVSCKTVFQNWKQKEINPRTMDNRGTIAMSVERNGDEGSRNIYICRQKRDAATFVTYSVL